eukprot:m.720285 g.720285  ORF g.720285 m.720285 type:complete len:514 (+) comp58818_c0_seq10:2647-4188(+)
MPFPRETDSRLTVSSVLSSRTETKTENKQQKERQNDSLEPSGSMSFVHKLHALTHHAGDTCIRWDTDGTRFCVTDRVIFERTVIPKWFAHTQYKSFQRQLNNYGFSRERVLWNVGGSECVCDTYKHPLFSFEATQSSVSNIHRGEPTQAKTEECLHLDAAPELALTATELNTLLQTQSNHEPTRPSATATSMSFTTADPAIFDDMAFPLNDPIPDLFASAVFDGEDSEKFALDDTPCTEFPIHEDILAVLGLSSPPSSQVASDQMHEPSPRQARRGPEAFDPFARSPVTHDFLLNQTTVSDLSPRKPGVFPQQSMAGTRLPSRPARMSSASLRVSPSFFLPARVSFTSFCASAQNSQVIFHLIATFRCFCAAQSPQSGRAHLRNSPRIAPQPKPLEEEMLVTSQLDLQERSLNVLESNAVQFGDHVASLQASTDANSKRLQEQGRLLELVLASVRLGVQPSFDDQGLTAQFAVRSHSTAFPDPISFPHPSGGRSKSEPAATLEHPANPFAFFN